MAQDRQQRLVDVLNSVEWYSIKEILETWGSCDSADTKKPLDSHDWNSLLETKRNDRCQYEDAIEFLQKDGFLVPLNYYINDAGYKIHGNGHHRLVAALDLGFTHVPYFKSQDMDIEFYDVEDFEDFTISLQPLKSPI